VAFALAVAAISAELRVILQKKICIILPFLYRSANSALDGEFCTKLCTHADSQNSDIPRFKSLNPSLNHHQIHCCGPRCWVTLVLTTPTSRPALICTPQWDSRQMLLPTVLVMPTIRAPRRRQYRSASRVSAVSPNKHHVKQGKFSNAAKFTSHYITMINVSRNFNHFT